MKIKKAIYIYIIFFVFLGFQVNSQNYIGKIYIDRREVFDSTQKDWFFAAKIANSLHTLTKQYVIEDELLFSEGDEIDFDILKETERNLRRTGIFTNVKIELDSVKYDIFDVYVTTQDRWSTRPSVLFGTGGNEETIGARLEELNFFGTGTRVSMEALYRTENNTGLQGQFDINFRRFLRSEFWLDGTLLANKYRTIQVLSLTKPYITLTHKSSYGVSAFNSYGNDFLFDNGKPEIMQYHERNIYGFYSHAWKKDDRVFITASLELEDIERGKPEYRRAYDNSGKFLVAFSSVSEDFIRTTKLNNFLVEDITLGGWGTAILGKIFPIGSRGESLYYVAGQGEQSYMGKNTYLFGQLTGASSFTNSRGLYTYQEFYGLAFQRLSEEFLLLSRIRQQTVWNWYGLRQLILDNYSGLRGYPANQLSGDNRIVANLELRFFSDLQFWIFKFGGSLFYDTGTVWKQNTHLGKTQWHHSAGFGLRIFDTKSTGDHGVFRIDFVYNFDKMKFGEIIFTTGQLFSAFKSHNYKLPVIYGSEFDVE